MLNAGKCAGYAAAAVFMAIVGGSSMAITSQGERGRIITLASLGEDYFAGGASGAAAAAESASPSAAYGAGSAITGGEPDPAAFDSAGLERWWQRYQQTHR
jgi:hypothetical protein